MVRDWIYGGGSGAACRFTPPPLFEGKITCFAPDGEGVTGDGRMGVRGR